MKHIILILSTTLLISAELEVDGNLKVTGTVESTTIDSLKQVIADLQAQLAALQGQGGLETRIFQLPTFNFEPYQSQSIILDLNEITGYNLNSALVTFYNLDNFDLFNNEEFGSSFNLSVEKHHITASGNDYWSSGCSIANVELNFNNSLFNASQGICNVNEHNRIKLSYGGDHAGGSFTVSIAVTSQFPN